MIQFTISNTLLYLCLKYEEQLNPTRKIFPIFPPTQKPFHLKDKIPFMGASASTSVAKNATKSALSVANTFSQACGTELTNTQVASLNGCDKAKIGQLNLSQKAAINVKCLQNASTQSQMQSAISSALTQQTSAATQALGIPSYNVATSVANAVSNLSIAVSNAYSQTCTATLDNTQKFACTNSSGISVGVINLNQNNQTLENCTASQDAVINAEANLASAIGQTTAAKQIDNFTTVVVVIFLILGIFAFGFMQFSKSETAKWIVIIILVVVIVLMAAYAYNAFENRLWPFQKKQ